MVSGSVGRVCWRLELVGTWRAARTPFSIGISISNSGECSISTNLAKAAYQRGKTSNGMVDGIRKTSLYWMRRISPAASSWITGKRVETTRPRLKLCVESTRDATKSRSPS